MMGVAALFNFGAIWLFLLQAMHLEKSDNTNHQRAGHIVNHETLSRFESLEQV